MRESDLEMSKGGGIQSSFVLRNKPSSVPHKLRERKEGSPNARNPSSPSSIPQPAAKSD